MLNDAGTGAHPFFINSTVICCRKSPQLFQKCVSYVVEFEVKFLSCGIM